MKKHYLTLLLTILLAVAASAQESKGTTPDDPTPMSLGGIILNGTKGDFYTITHKLYGVYVPPHFKNVVFAKDNNNNVNKSEPTDYPSNKIYDNFDDFDQSNWIKILFPTGYDASAYEGKEITSRTVTGRINVASAPGGPVGIYIDVDPENPPTAGADFEYEGNMYNCANFVQQDWFFVKPKNLEYCNIHWAVYNGENKFYVPKISDWPGSFKVDMKLWENQNEDFSVTADDVFTVGHAYEFPAIIQFSVDYQIGLNIDPGFDGDINYGDKAPRLRVDETVFEVGEGGTLPEGYRNVVVYPLRIKEDIITAIDQVETASEVKSVQYYDLQGRMSNAPLKGVNIKVTTYTDGTRETKKIVR